MTRELLHAWLMPWAEFTETLDLGSIQIWDFYKEGPSRISDSQEMLWLAQLMSYFRDKFGANLTRLSVVQHGNEPFGAQSPENNNKIRWTGHAICFAYLTGRIAQLLKPDRRFAGVGNSERYQLMGMVVDNDEMLHYVHAGSAGTTELKSKRIVFTEPPQMGDKIDAPDRLLLKGLAALNDTQAESDLWRRLGVCFDWFSSGWSAAQEVTAASKIISLMTSFEALARQSDRDGAYDMGLYSSNLCNWTDLPQLEQIRLSQDVSVNKPVFFIWQFSRYRNACVHGDRLPVGLIRHCIGDVQFFPHEVMSLVIHAMVSNLLLQAGAWSEEWEIEIVQSQLRRIIELLHWSTNEKVLPSPHENLNT